MYNGQKINELLKEKGIRKQRLTEFLNTSSSGLEAVIHGNPTVNTIDRVARFFNVPIESFFIKEATDKEIENEITGTELGQMNDIINK